MVLPLLILGCGEPESEAPPPPAVEVAAPQLRDVTAYYHYTGRLAAAEQVQVVARVPGFVQAMHFTPSSDVKATDKLFTIEPDTYRVAVNAAEAEIARAEALRQAAQIEFDKADAAFKQNVASEQERLEYEATLKQREAELKAAQAAHDQAKIDLGYTEVTARIDGRVGRQLVDVGNVVNAGDPLTTVVKMQPIHLYIDVSDKITQEYINRGRTGEVAEDQREDEGNGRIEIRRSSDPEGQYPFVGRIEFVDNTVDSGTGTLLVRGEFANKNRALYPGMPGIRARVPYDIIEDAVIIPEDALLTDLTGKFVYIIGEDNKAVKRPVELGQLTDDGQRVILNGLTGDERVVVRGLQKVVPGEPVTIRETPEAEDGPAGDDPAEEDQPAGDASS
jgi:RND family efflux transporter MFP subunit